MICTMRFRLRNVDETLRNWGKKIHGLIDSRTINLKCPVCAKTGREIGQLDDEEAQIFSKTRLNRNGLAKVIRTLPF